MPTVSAQGKLINCEPGANLRQVLLEDIWKPGGGV